MFEHLGTLLQIDKLVGALEYHIQNDMHILAKVLVVVASEPEREDMMKACHVMKV